MLAKSSCKDVDIDYACAKGAGTFVVNVERYIKAADVCAGFAGKEIAATGSCFADDGVSACCFAVM